VFVIPECFYRGSIGFNPWIPAFAGMTVWVVFIGVNLCSSVAKQALDADFIRVYSRPFAVRF